LKKPWDGLPSLSRSCKFHLAGVTRLEIILVIFTLLVLASTLWPLLREMRQTSNEASALGFCHQVGLAQQAFRESCHDDQNGNQVGEFTWLGTLLGHFPCRTPSGPGSLSPCFLPGYEKVIKNQTIKI